MIAVRNVTPIGACSRERVRPCFTSLVDPVVTVTPLRELAGTTVRLCCALRYSKQESGAQQPRQFAHLATLIWRLITEKLRSEASLSFVTKPRVATGIAGRRNHF